MDARQLRYFTAIYEHGSLSTAAQHVRVAVSALSHHLANLEAGLSTALFVRKPRGLQPTAAGERLYVHAKSILKAIAAAERDIRGSGGEISGEVSVGLSHSVVKAIGVPLARAVLADYPKLRLCLTEGLSGSIVMHLVNSEVDVALVYNPTAEPALKTTPVLEERLVCVGRREIIGDTDAPISFAELLELPLLSLRPGLSTRAIIDDPGLLKKLESRAMLQMNSLQAIGGSLVAGLGCLVGTTLIMQEHLQSGVLHFRPIVEPEMARTLYLCEMAGRPATFALETVRDLILELVDEAVRTGRWEAQSLVPGASVSRASRS